MRNIQQERITRMHKKVLNDLRNINGSDPELAHGWADQYLCDLLDTLGYKDVVEAWNKVDKWYA